MYQNVRLRKYIHVGHIFKKSIKEKDQILEKMLWNGRDFPVRDETHYQLYVPNMKSKLNRQVLLWMFRKHPFVNVCRAMFSKIVSFLQLQTNPFFTISATRVHKLPSLIFDSQRNRLKLQLD